MQLPRYDKAAFSGAGDTAPKGAWPTITGPLDLVLFEGWMLGFTAQGPQVSAGTHQSLDAVDQYLAAYKDAWDGHVHAWLVVAVENPRWVFQWRQEAETQMRKQGRGGMTDEQVEQFVQRYMPAYTAYLPALYEFGPTTCQPGHWLKIGVDERRCLKLAGAR
jgi:D-glycerate 3-kinase